VEALAATVLVAWGLCFASGMHRPRYAYVTLPPLCALAGGVAAALPDCLPRIRRALWIGAAGLITTYGAAVIGMSSWLATRRRELALGVSTAAILLATAVLALTVAVVACRALRRGGDWHGLWGVPALLMLLAIPMGAYGYSDRIRRSARSAAGLVRSTAGAGASLMTCAMVLDQPELFYYSGLPTRATNGNKLDWRDVPPGSWVVLEAPELQTWRQELSPQRLGPITSFIVNRNPGYLLQYLGDEPSAPAVLPPPATTRNRGH
jgi:hypothetical protein